MAGNRRRILITGATAGIGLALARRLADRHQVMVTGRRNPVEVRDLLPSGCIYVQSDQSQPEESATPIAQALSREGWPHLDYAVLNAATGFVAPQGTDSARNIRATLDTNLVAVMLQASALHPWLEVNKGTLTLVGSVAHSGSSAIPAYAASKAGLNAFARALRSEWKGRVHVQVLHPGPTRTAMHEKAGYDPGWMANLFLDPRDMAGMVAFAMASRRSPVTLGWLRFLSGGAYMGRPL